MASEAQEVSGVNFNFISTFEPCPEDSEVHNIIGQVTRCESDALYKELIESALLRYSKDYKECNGVYTRNILIELFARTSSKKNLKKYMFEKLNLMKIEDKTFFEYIIDDVTTEIVENLITSKVFKIKQNFLVLYFLLSYTQSLDNDSNYEHLLQKTIRFYLCIMEVFTSQLFNKKFRRDGCEGKSILEYEDCYNVLDLALKQMVLATTRTNYTCIQPYALKFVEHMYEMLKFHNQLKFETISRCSLLFSYFLSVLPIEEKEFVKWKNYPILDFLLNEETEFTVVLKSRKLKNLFSGDTMKVVLNITMYNSIDANTLLELQIGQNSLLEFLYLNVIRLGKQMTSCPDHIIQITKTLNKMAENLVRLKNFDKIFYEGYTFSWAHLDHFVDPVVTAIKSFLKTLVSQAVIFYEKGETSFLVNFFKSLSSMSTFSKVRMNALSCICQEMHTDYILKYCPQTQNQLLILIANSALHDMAGHVYVHLMKKYLNELPEEEFIKIWLQPVLKALKQPNCKYGFTLKEIITCAFKIKPTLLRKLFNPKTMGTTAECVIVLKCLHFARIHGISLPIEPEIDENEYWRKLINKSKLELFMIHQDEEVRISVLQAIAECQKSTEEFSDWELTFLIKYFQFNVSTQIPSTRNKIVSFYKKIFTRYQTSYNVLARRIINLENHRDEDSVKELKANILIREAYTNFLLQFSQILVINLCPDSNYSRRSVSLELLLFLHGICEPSQWRDLFLHDDIRNLKYMLNDSYESNKMMAVSVLRTLPPASVGFDSKDNTRKYFEKSLQMACDVRPSQSLSACYMFQLILHSHFPFKDHKKETSAMTNNNQCLMALTIIEKLEEMFHSCNEDIMEAAKSTPFYGLLLSARNLLCNRDIRENNEVYAFIFNKLANLCLTMKAHIMPVVCNSSPEGHIPDSSDDSDDSFLESDQSSKAQMILVYSWKTMKEIMLVLAELANQTVTLENVLGMLSEEYLLNIGDFFMDIFIQTKHRGVFEQAHVAFSTICRSFIHSKNENLNNLPPKWLQEAIALCTGKKTDDRLCATRRSAGLPFLILSIVPSLAETNRDYLKRTVEPLLCVAGGTNVESDELRMHCLNVLRFMFNNSKLSDMIAYYIDKGVIAALLGFKSRSWGVRNSSTLLLSTLITKMFGVPRSCTDIEETNIKNRLTLGVFYMRFPKLLDFLLKMLAEESGKIDSLILHPVLLVLSRLYPSHNEKINSLVEKHIPYINICMANPSYRTRDLAARASVSLISENLLEQQLHDNFKKISSDNITDNQCHGLLLQVRHILYMCSFDDLPISAYLENSIHILTKAGKQFSHLTVCLYMQIIFTLLTKFMEYNDLELLKEIIMLLSKQTISNEITCKTAFAWSRFQLLLFILMTKFPHVSSTYQIITRIIIKSLYGSDIEMKKRCLYLLIYLNQQYSDDPYKEHPLITSGDIEICPLIKSLIHSLDFKSKKELLTYTHPYLISFFYAELKAQLKQDENYLILIFLLLRFYPCFFNSLRTDRKQNILDWFLTMTEVYNEEIVSVVISCLKTFILTLDHDEMKHLRYSDLIRLLMESASPGAADYRRLTVAQFLVGTHVLYKCKIFTEFDRYNVLNIIMVLLEDEELIVRNTMSLFPFKHDLATTGPILRDIIPNKARSILLLTSGYEFRKEVAICCLVSWALRRLPEPSADASEIYERGELNLFAENIPVTRSATEVLHNMLWPMGQFLSFEDKSIFLEEQTLLITTLVLNSLIKIPSPMVDKQTKRTVICVLKCIVKFIEECTIGNDFHKNFAIFFNTKILKFLRASLKTDYSSVKSFLTYFYNPVLNIHFKFPSNPLE